MSGRLLITTSREPSRRTRSFVKDFSAVVPHSVRVVRGKATISELAVKASSLGAYGVLIVLEKKGNPSALVFAIPERSVLKKLFLLKLGGVSLLRELPDSLVPLGLKELVIAPRSVPRGFPEAVSVYLVNCLRPKIVERPEGRAVELKLVGGETEGLVMFMCVTSDRECGPRFKVVRIVDYAKETKLP